MTAYALLDKNTRVIPKFLISMLLPILQVGWRGDKRLLKFQATMNQINLYAQLEALPNPPRTHRYEVVPDWVCEPYDDNE